MSSIIPFVHLHVHSEYSLLDGLCPLDRGKDHKSPLMERVLDVGQKAIALTDHGNLYGAVHFYQGAEKHGVKPIMGCEVYITPDGHTSRVRVNGKVRNNHLVLLAENETGWFNLMRLVSTAHLYGEYYKPRIDRPLLAQYHEGLIALSACLKGEVAEAFVEGRDAEAKALAAEYSDIMGPGNFFLELQDHGLPEQARSASLSPRDTPPPRRKRPGLGQSAGSRGKGGFSNDWKKSFQWLENLRRFFQ